MILAAIVLVCAGAYTFLDLYTVRLDYVNDDTYVLDYRWRKGI